MATFTGNAQGYRVDVLANGKIRVVDIDASNGDEGNQFIDGGEILSFADHEYELSVQKEVLVSNTLAAWRTPLMASLSNGSYVLAWQPASGMGLQFQHFDAQGSLIGAELNLLAETEVIAPQIVSLAKGGFVVTWMEEDSSAYDLDVYAQRFNAAGEALGDKFLVNSTASANQYSPQVAHLADGGFVIAWVTYNNVNGEFDDVCAQRFDASGAKVGKQVVINTTIEGEQNGVDIEGLANGDYLVSWTSRQIGSYLEILYSQRFNAAGEKVGGQTEIVRSDWDISVSASDITALKGGGYVVSWLAYDFNSDTSAFRFQKYDPSGHKVGGEKQVDDAAREVEITALADGGFLMTWTLNDRLNYNESDIFAQRYDAAGKAIGNEHRINNTDIEGVHSSATVTALANGGYVVSWICESNDDHFVYSRRFDADGNAVTAGVILKGTADADFMQGGMGVQHLYGADGDDRLFGGRDDDELGGQDGNDKLLGGLGDDYLVGGAGKDILYGSLGKDILHSGPGTNDVLNGGLGGDILHADDSKTAQLNGDDGIDVLYADYSDGAVLYGGEGNDTLCAVHSRGANLNGNAGDDMLDARASFGAVLNGGTDNDLLRAARSYGATLNGGDGEDTLYANRAEQVTMNGGAGNDRIFARYEDCVMNGGDGDDILFVGGGSCKLAGNAGSDAFWFDRGNYYYYGLEYVAKILDFSAAEDDVIQLDNHSYEKLTYTGALKSGNFTANAGGTALDKDDFIVYDTDTGILYYDDDGSGSHYKQTIAQLIGKPTLTAADLDVV